MAVLSGDELAAINEAYGVQWTESDAEEAKQRYAGMSAGELKLLGERLRPFDPEPTQIAAARGLLLAGVTVTRLLGSRGEGSGDEQPPTITSLA